ncbi:MAG: AlkZ family DNA glycosylase [Deltaproteobacteria bacterium]|nr:AlkZ family DNA glycosylase [Deltaproteobacteria bacterium]
MLTERQLNRALLARQCLLERASLSVPRALEAIGGIQAQYAPSSYVGLWSRLNGFERADLTRALERRTVVQGTLMRATIHLVSARDYALIAAAIREGRRSWWLAVTKHPDESAVRDAAARMRALLAEGPKKRAELQKTLGVDNTTFAGIHLWVDVLRIPPSGTWEARRADLFAAADDWLGSGKSPTPDSGGANDRVERPRVPTREEGLELLVRRYLGGFGPSTVKDLANWSGLPQSAFSGTIAGIRLRRFRDERGEELIDLPRAPIPDADSPAPPRFLPTWDATLLVHARRTQILPERHRARIFSTKTPQSVSTFLLDGRVAGTWRESGARVQLEPFERPAPASKRALEEEAHRLETFLAPGSAA